ncbi:hypothetical protein LXA43DRAFT_920768 [Ganoderma leucocontextum]|nr:hypothetical protein LXA43DRAFT_920768 [Ganoderma leucocontextum]
MGVQTALRNGVVTHRQTLSLQNFGTNSCRKLQRTPTRSPLPIKPPSLRLTLYRRSTMSPTYLDWEPTELVPDGAFIASPELEGAISLETAIGNPYVVDQEALLTAWEQLSAVSVEAAGLGRPELFEFADNHCLLFAAVRTPVRVEIPPGVELKTLGLSDDAAVVYMDSPISPSDPSAIYALVSRYYEQMHPTSTSSSDGVEDDGQCSSPSSESPPPDNNNKKTVYKWETIGVVYVTMSCLPHEVHVGVGLLPTFRGKGAGMKACAFAVQWAIETISAHRVQARILISPSRSRAQRLFTALGFTHEGIQRRAVPDATGAWVDVTCMGVVDTDWIMRGRLRAVPRNLWDELFARHQREREELLRWEECQGRLGLGLRRTSSMETVRGERDPALMVPEALSEDDSESECGTPSMSSSASYRSLSPKPEESEPAGERSWRSPSLSVPNAENSDAEDAFSDTEWIMDILRSPEEPISRPVSAASWSSFESIGSGVSSASSTHGLTEGMSGVVM